MKKEILTPIFLALTVLMISKKSNALNISDTAECRESEVITSNKKIAKFPALLKGNEKHSLAYIEKFAENRRNYLIRTYNRGKNFFPKISTILKKYNVPEEFRVLIALESGFNPNARSRAGALGYWQIMDNVAREYGLRVGAAKKVKGKTVHSADDRKNFLKSTYAAAKYLRDRCRNLDQDWLLIAASYNWGVGNVWNAMKRTGKKDPTFWDIRKYMPMETKTYVMNFIAMNVIFHNYNDFLSGNLVFEQTEEEEEYQAHTALSN